MDGREENTLGADFEGNTVCVTNILSGVDRYLLIWIMCVLIAFVSNVFTTFLLGFAANACT